MRRVLLLILCLLLLTASVGAAGDQITALTEEVTVAEDGDVSVAATAQLSFTGSVTSFVFPLGKGAEHITASGGTYVVKRIDGVECVEFTNSSGFSGKQTFQCSYTLPRAVTNTDIGQQFDFSPIARGWEFPMESLTLHITFPVEVSARPVWSSAYYGDVIDNYLNIRVQDKQVDVSSVTAFKDHETLTMQLQFAPGAYSLHNLVGTTESVSRLIFYLLALAALVYWLLRLRGRLLLPKAQQTIDMEATAGEIPTRLYGLPTDVAATLVHWGNLGYLTIHRTRNGRLRLIKKMEMGNERKPAERRLFAAVFRSGETCDPTTERFRRVTAAASAQLRGGWLRRCFRKKSGSPRVLRLLSLLAAVPVSLLTFDLLLPSTWVRWVLLPLLLPLPVVLCDRVQRGLAYLLRRRDKLIAAALSALALLLLGAWAGCFGTMLLNLLLQAFCALVTLYGGRRTEEGDELVRGHLGMRRYLRKATTEELQRNAESDGQYFYRTLPFAELLGVGGAFAKHYGGGRLESCPWLTLDGKKPENAAEFYRLYTELMRQLRGEDQTLLARLMNPPKRKPPVAVRQ